MQVDVYHSGDERRPLAPFLLTRVGERVIPPHPLGSKKPWIYWKAISLGDIAVKVSVAETEILTVGFYIQ